MQTECVEIYEPLHNFRYVDEAGKLETLKLEIEKAYSAAEKLGDDAGRYVNFIARTFDPAPLISNPLLASSSLALFNKLCAKPDLENLGLLIESLQLDIDALYKRVEDNNKG
jgi:hypothetical protein